MKQLEEATAGDFGNRPRAWSGRDSQTPWNSSGLMRWPKPDPVLSGLSIW